MDDYNPKSVDSMFSTVLVRMNAHDKKLDDILTQVYRINGRVTAIERWRDVIRARVGVIACITSASVAVIAWVLEHFLA